MESLNKAKNGRNRQDSKYYTLENEEQKVNSKSTIAKKSFINKDNLVTISSQLQTRIVNRIQITDNFENDDKLSRSKTANSFGRKLRKKLGINNNQNQETFKAENLQSDSNLKAQAKNKHQILDIIGGNRTNDEPVILLNKSNLNVVQNSELLNSSKITTEIKRKSSIDEKIANLKLQNEEEPTVDYVSPRRSNARNDFENFPSNFNPKVMENWINETLGDAEHLNIPGILLKPENKVPVSRYRIDRMTLMKGGIPNESINRIYRSLFVYSVGFYDLIVRCMEHSEQNHSVVSSIWKVFAILIEYCCKSDYTMLISSLANEHKKELDKINSDFAEKCDIFNNIEKQLRESITLLEKELQTLK